MCCFVSCHRNKRGKRDVHPRTPDPTEEVSKRAFDGRIKAWRRELHKWDSAEQSLAIGVNKKQQVVPGSVMLHTAKTDKVKSADCSSGDVNGTKSEVSGSVTTSSSITGSTPVDKEDVELRGGAKFTTGERRVPMEMFVMFLVVFVSCIVVLKLMDYLFINEPVQRCIE